MEKIDILELIDRTLDDQPPIAEPVDPFLFGEHLPEEEIDAHMDSTGPVAYESRHYWVSNGKHNDDPALLGGYGR